MIEYNISLIFNKVWSIFSNHKGEKRQKCTFLSYKMHFFKNCKNDPIITCDMSFERFFHGENNTIIIFVKYWKLAFLETKNHFCFFCNFFLFFAILHFKGQFSIFFIFDKNFESYISRPFNRHITSKNLKIFEGMTKKFI